MASLHSRDAIFNDIGWAVSLAEHKSYPSDAGWLVPGYGLEEYHSWLTESQADDVTFLVADDKENRP